MPKQKLYLDDATLRELGHMAIELAGYQRRTEIIVDHVATSQLRNVLTELNIALSVADAKIREIMTMHRETPSSNGG